MSDYKSYLKYKKERESEESGSSSTSKENSSYKSYLKYKEQRDSESTKETIPSVVPETKKSSTSPSVVPETKKDTTTKSTTAKETTDNSKTGLFENLFNKVFNSQSLNVVKQKAKSDTFNEEATSLSKRLEAQYAALEDPDLSDDERAELEYAIKINEDKLKQDTEIVETAKSANEKQFYSDLEKKQNKTYKDTWAGQFAANYNVGDLQQSMALAYNNYIENPTEDNLKYAEALKEASENLQTNNTKALNHESDFFLSNWTSQDLAQYLPQLKNQAQYELAPALAGVVVGLAFANPVAGGKAGLTLGSGQYSYQTMRGFAYEGLIELGVDPDIAAAASTDEAVISSLIEMSDTALSVATLGGSTALKEIIEGGIKKFVGTNTFKKLVTALAKYGLNIASEGEEEATQESVSIANENRIKEAMETGEYNGGVWDLAKDAANIYIDSFRGSSDNADRIQESRAGGQKIAAMMGGVEAATGSVANLMNNQSKTTSTQVNEEWNNNSEAQEAFAQAEFGETPSETLRQAATEMSENSVESSMPYTENTTQTEETDDAWMAEDFDTLFTTKAEWKNIIKNLKSELKNPDLTESERAELKNELANAKNQLKGKTSRKTSDYSYDDFLDSLPQEESSEISAEQWDALSESLDKAFANENLQTSEPTQQNIQEETKSAETGDFKAETQNSETSDFHVDQDIVTAYASKLDSEGSKAIKANYNSSVNPNGYITEFTQYYNAGLTGNSNYVKGVSRYLTPQQRESAFKAGVKDRVVSQKRSESNNANAGFDYASNKGYDKSKAKTLDTLGKKLGIRITFGESTVGDRGSYNSKTKTLTISKDADAILEVVKHEITHRMQDLSPKQYQEYKDFVTEYYRKNGRLESLVSTYMDRYREVVSDFSRNDALDEIVSDFTAELFVEEDAFSDLVNTNRNLAQKIYDILVDIINSIKGVLGKSEVQQLTEAEKKWKKLLEASEKAAEKLETGESRSENTRYSLKDSEGKTLTEKQAEYFKDSKVRDKKGNLQVVYHGTGTAFTKFERNLIKRYDFGYGFYFTDNYYTASEYAAKAANYDGENNKVMAGYVNITNPLSERKVELFNDDNMRSLLGAWQRDELIDEDYDIDDAIMDAKQFDSDASRYSYLISQTNNMEEAVDYIPIYTGGDGIIHNTNDGVYYIAFDSSQFKNIDNTNPTDNKDIRYSLKDSEGNSLSKAQQEYFKDSKAIDEDGNLLVVYHGSTQEFTVFDTELYGSYFTPNKRYAEGYARGHDGYPKNLKAYYLNIKNPFDTRNAKERDIFYDEFYRKYGNGANLQESGLPDWTDGDDLVDFAKERGYDAVLLNEGAEYSVEPGHEGEIIGRDISYVIFDPEQAKLTTNQNPTSDKDIRYSIKTDRSEEVEQSLSKKGKKYNALADKRDSGEKLTYEEFKSFYQAHKIFEGKTDNEKLDIIQSIKENGFKSGSHSVLSINVISANNDNSNASLVKYRPKEGEYVLLVPDFWIHHNDKRGEDYIAEGYKPLPYEVVKVEYSSQPYYELYDKAYNEYFGIDAEPYIVNKYRGYSYEELDALRKEYGEKSLAYEYGENPNKKKAKEYWDKRNEVADHMQRYFDQDGVRYSLKTNAFEHLRGWNESDENQISFTDVMAQMESEKMTGEKAFLQAMQETIDNVADNHFSTKYLRAMYQEYPEMDFMVRFKNQDPGTKADLEKFLSGIDDINLLYKISNMIPQLYTYGTRGKYSSVATKFRKIVGERIQEIGAEKEIGRNLGLQEGYATFDDIQNLFFKLNQNKESEQLARRVFNTAKDLGLQIRFENALMGHTRSGGVASGRYVQYKLNMFNSTTVSDQFKANTLLHEVIHACTSYAIWNYEHGGYNLTSNMEMACETLEQVYRQIRHDPRFAGQYGLKDVYEMVAELANEDFRGKLQQKNLLQVVIDSILRVFGVIRKDVKTAYDVASETLYWMLDNVSTEVYEEYSEKARRSLSNSGKRFSLKSASEYQKQVNALERQNESLRKTSARLSNEITASTKITDADAKRITESLLAEYPASMTKKDLQAKILEMYRTYANAKDANQAYENLRKEATELATKLVEESKVITNPNYENYAELRTRLQKALRGDKKRMDSVYQDLMEEYYEFFSTENITSEDAVEEIQGVLDNLKDKMLKNPFKGDEDMVSEYAANEIVALMFDAQIDTFAGKMGEKIKAMKKSKAEAVAKQKANDKARMEKIIQDNRTKREQLIQDMNKASEEKIQKLMDKYRAKTEEGRAKQDAKILRNRILNHAKALSDKLLKATDKKHIPQELQGITATLLSYLNMESSYATDFETGERVKNVNLNDPNKAYEITKRTAAASSLRQAYEDFLKDTGFTEDDFDADMIFNLRAIEKMGDTPIGLLDVGQLTTIWNTIRSVEAMITNYNKALVESKFAQVSDFAYGLRSDNAGKSRASLNRGLGKADKLINLDSLTPQAYFHRLGETGEEIFRVMRKAQDEHITLMDEFRADIKSIVQGVDINSLEKKVHKFNLGGRSFEMSTAQVMALHETIKRPQAFDHIFTGGIRPRVIQKGVKKASTAEPLHLSPGDIANIDSVLTDEQKALADKLQKFISTKPAEAGNKASMLVYGYKKFGEKNYYPLDVDRNEVRSEIDKGEGISTTVASMSSAKATVQGANNAIFINSIFDDIAQNCNDMAKYSAWLAPLDTINKIRNFKFKDASMTKTVSTILENVFGSGGRKYWRDLLNDINNSSGSDHAFTEDMVGKMKAASIAGNVRVIVQQPTAILRALAVIDAKYLNKGIVTKGDWDKVRRYAPIAVWKDWGYFDINTGRSMKDILFDTDSKLEKLTEKAMEPAGKADSITWSRLWNACEYEIMDTSDLRQGTEEFYQAVAERFNEIIDETQVVDGVLQRSQLMRSQNTLNKWATSFMSEPTKTLNMVLSAEYDKHNAKTSEERKQARRKITRTMAALSVSIVANAIAQSLVDAARDSGDDDDDKYWERFIEAFCGIAGEETSFKSIWSSNMGDALDPIGYIPYLKDIKSLLQGYTIERMDMSLISDVVYSAKNVYKAISGNGKKTIASTVADFFLQVSRLCGLPVYNIKRDVMALFDTIVEAIDDPKLTKKVNKVKNEFNFR